MLGIVASGFLNSKMSLSSAPVNLFSATIRANRRDNPLNPRDRFRSVLVLRNAAHIGYQIRSLTSKIAVVAQSFVNCPALLPTRLEMGGNVQSKNFRLPQFRLRIFPQVVSDCEVRISVNALQSSRVDDFLISPNSGDVEGTRTSTHSVPSPTDRPTGFVILGNRVFRNAISSPWSKISEALTLTYSVIAFFIIAAR